MDTDTIANGSTIALLVLRKRMVDKQFGKLFKEYATYRTYSMSDGPTLYPVTWKEVSDVGRQN